MSLRLCYIPYLWGQDLSLANFKKILLNGGASLDDFFAVITVRNHGVSEEFLQFLSLHGLDKGLIYKSTEAVSYRYPAAGPRLTLRVYSFKGLL